MKITATRVLAKDLKPGDLFSTAGPEYWAWATSKHNRSQGEKVYIRTTEPAVEHDDVREPLYRITILAHRMGWPGEDEIPSMITRDDGDGT